MVNASIPVVFIQNKCVNVVQIAHCLSVDVLLSTRVFYTCDAVRAFGDSLHVWLINKYNSWFFHAEQRFWTFDNAVIVIILFLYTVYRNTFFRSPGRSVQPTSNFRYWKSIEFFKEKLICTHTLCKCHSAMMLCCSMNSVPYIASSCFVRSCMDQSTDLFLTM